MWLNWRTWRHITYQSSLWILAKKKQRQVQAIFSFLASYRQATGNGLWFRMWQHYLRTYWRFALGIYQPCIIDVVTSKCEKGCKLNYYNEHINTCWDTYKEMMGEMHQPEITPQMSSNARRAITLLRSHSHEHDFKNGAWNDYIEHEIKDEEHLTLWFEAWIWS